MKTRTNQPVFYDNGQKVDDSALGGTKLYNHFVKLNGQDLEIRLCFISNSNKTIKELKDDLDNHLVSVLYIEDVYDGTHVYGGTISASSNNLELRGIDSDLAGYGKNIPYNDIDSEEIVEL